MTLFAENVHDTSPHKVKEGDTTLDAVMKAGAVEMGEEGEESKVEPSVEGMSEGQPEGKRRGVLALITHSLFLSNFVFSDFYQNLCF